MIARQGRPLWAEIDLDAIDHNLREVRRRISAASQVMAVVKANAYGHGAIAVAKASLQAGATYLGVACVDEGIELRRAGLAAPIVILGYVPPWEAPQVVQYQLIPSLASREAALALAQASSQGGVRTPVHVKVDTGMARFGLLPGEVEDFCRFLQTLPALSLQGIYTHFAAADEADKTYTWKQFRTFQQVTERLPQPLMRHAANSAAIVDLPEMALDMVRPGIVLYGCLPSSQSSSGLDLRAGLALKSWVARIHTLAPGEPVSYGRTWVAPRPTRIALIPCGYADGLPRLVSNQGSVLIHGQRAPIVGRVCMDQHMVNVTHIPDVAVHDEVVLIGHQGEETITATEVAELAQTISYEVLCAISARVPRFYLRDGQVVGKRTLVDTEEVESTE